MLQQGTHEPLALRTENVEPQPWIWNPAPTRRQPEPTDLSPCAYQLINRFNQSIKPMSLKTSVRRWGTKRPDQYESARQSLTDATRRHDNPRPAMYT